MPRVKWGAGEDALTAADVDNADVNDYQPYAGEIPPGGVYRFRLRRARSTKSSNDNPMLKVLLLLDGTWKPQHKQFEGCPLWAQTMVMKSTAHQVRAFCDALGLTSTEFLTKMVADEDGVVQKIGTLAIADQDLLVYANVKRGEYNGEVRLEMNGNGYLPLEDDDTDEESEPEEPDEDAEEDADEDLEDEDVEEEPEPTPPPRKAVKRAAAPAKTAPAPAARRPATAAKKAGSARRVAREEEAPF